MSIFFMLLFVILIDVSASQNIQQPIREYYIAAIDIEWNYLPEETAIYFYRRRYAERYVNKGPDRIGTIYKKSVFRGYTDASFTRSIDRPSWLGILGPLVAAEVGDLVLVHVWNNASHNLTFHTHGAFYEKPSEGAYTYFNNSDGNLLTPNEKFTYTLNISKELGPTKSDLDCLIMAYHSHIDGDSDIVTGLVGPMIICKKGTLNNYLSSPKYVLLFLVFDENSSWYIDENIRRYIGNLTDQELQNLRSNRSFMESNRKYSINGLMYDNLPNLKVCLQTMQTWHIIGFGNEIDLHNVIFGAHSMIYNGHRTDRVHVTPGIFLTTFVTPHHVGTFSITSAIGNYYLNGMQANFTVENCDKDHKIRKPIIRGVRHYYIAIEEVLWDYAPTGRNMITGQTLAEDRDAQENLFRGSCRNGTVYRKAKYTEYTDEFFRKRKATEWYMGLLGPVLHAEVGEKLMVTVFNTARFPFNFYSPAFSCEGCPHENRDPIASGEIKTYSFLITESHSPTDKDLPCVNWPYTSNVDPWDQFAGLIGIIKTCRPGSLDNNGNQIGVIEYSLLFALIDEFKSPYYEENMRRLLTNASNCDTQSFFFQLSNRIHVINGWVYGNLFGLRFCLHRNILINLISLHDEDQMHVVRFEENIFTFNGFPKTTVELSPGDHKQILLSPYVSGRFLVNCHVNGHLLYGMSAFFNVFKCSPYDNEFILTSGKEHHYYIAAEEVIWDYTPDMIHPIDGDNLETNENSRPFVINNATRIGHRFKKVIYQEYTDATFTTRKPRETHLAILGPTIRAEVYSVVKIVFRNLASRKYNIQPQGLITLYHRTVPPVNPGETILYTWLVPQKAGPAINGFFSINRLYYSTVDLVRDSQSGLFGMIVIYAPGYLGETGLNIKGVREFSTVFAIMDENESWYLDYNINTFCKNPAAVNRNDVSFIESNLKYSINGQLYGSIRGLEGNIGDTVIIYLCGQGNVEIHTDHLHGLTFIEKPDITLPFGHEEDVAEVFPGICRPLKLILSHVGVWIFHCHVDSHMRSGMIGEMTVYNGTFNSK